MNVLAVFAWLFMNPLRELQALSSAALRTRLIFFIGLIIFVITALVYTKFLMKKAEIKPASPARITIVQSFAQPYPEARR